jgi:hypothetical protein
VIATDQLEYVGMGVRLILKCAYKRNIEAHSRNPSCRGKGKIIPYSECVCVCSLSYPACIAGCCLSGLPIFFHKRHDFRENIIEYKICFDFSYKFCMKYFSF